MTGDLLAFADWVAESSATPSGPEADDPERLYVAFELDGEAYGLPIERVLEVLRVGEIQHVPQAPAHVRGVSNVRGAILPIVEVRTRIGLDPLDPTPAARIVRVEAGGRSLGFLVDRVIGLRKVRASQVGPAEVVIAGMDACLSGVAEGKPGPLALLDPDRVLGAPGAERETERER